MSKIESFRKWHEDLVQSVYNKDENVQMELRRAREKFLEGLLSKGEV